MLIHTLSLSLALSHVHLHLHPYMHACAHVHMQTFGKKYMFGRSLHVAAPISVVWRDVDLNRPNLTFLHDVTSKLEHLLSYLSLRSYHFAKQCIIFCLLSAMLITGICIQGYMLRDAYHSLVVCSW